MNDVTSPEQETTRRVEEELQQPVLDYDGSQPLWRDSFWKHRITIHI